MDQWRKQWRNGTQGETEADFPFGVVQIGPMTGKKEQDPGSFEIRQGQTASVGYLPNDKWPKTFLAVAYDLPNPPGSTCPSGEKACKKSAVLSP
jgi:hypothetical protein